MSKLIDWTGQIFNGCEILEPVDKMKIKCKDKRLKKFDSSSR